MIILPIFRTEQAWKWNGIGGVACIQSTNGFHQTHHRFEERIDFIIRRNVWIFYLNTETHPIYHTRYFWISFILVKSFDNELQNWKISCISPLCYIKVRWTFGQFHQFWLIPGQRKCENQRNSKSHWSSSDHVRKHVENQNKNGQSKTNMYIVQTSTSCYPKSNPNSFKAFPLNFTDLPGPWQTISSPHRARVQRNK